MTLMVASVGLLAIVLARLVALQWGEALVDEDIKGRG